MTLRFLTFVKSGKEVLHLGREQSESNLWPIEHWHANTGRFRLFPPGIDAYLNGALAEQSFGSSVDKFVLVLEVADFGAWESGVFSGPDGHVSFKDKRRELWSVGKLSWPEIQHLAASEQLKAFKGAFTFATARAAAARRRPRDFDFEAFFSAVAGLLEAADVNQLSKTAWRETREA